MFVIFKIYHHILFANSLLNLIRKRLNVPRGCNDMLSDESYTVLKTGRHFISVDNTGTHTGMEFIPSNYLCL